MNTPRPLAAVLLALSALLASPLHSAEPPSDAARRAREEEERKRKEEEEEARERAAAAGTRVGEPRPVAKRSVRIVDKEEWDRLHKTPDPTDESKLTVISEKYLKPSAARLGRTLRVLQGEGYRLSRKEILPYGAANRIVKMPHGYAVDTGSSVLIYDRNGRRVLSKSPASIWSVNLAGRVGLYNDVRGRSSSDKPRLCELLSPTGRVAASLPLTGIDVVDIAPDGKSIMAWQKHLGNLIGPLILPTTGRLHGKQFQYHMIEKVRFHTTSGSSICLSAKVRGTKRTMIHLSPTGRAIYTKSGSFFPHDATPDGYVVFRTSTKPYRIFVWDPTGKEVFTLSSGQYSTPRFIGGHQYLAIHSLLGHRELHSTFYRVSDGKEFCEIPTTCTRTVCVVDGGRVICYEPRGQLLSVYDLATSRRLRRTVLRHREPRSLRPTDVRVENGALLFTSGGRQGDGHLVYYKIELTDG